MPNKLYYDSVDILNDTRTSRASSRKSHRSSWLISRMFVSERSGVQSQPLLGEPQAELTEQRQDDDLPASYHGRRNLTVKIEELS